ncbi:MAG: D-sedoheptulose 7-phosphate isomerase [Candidatus Omnitrophica bacterium]|nr:D-sedoheptulose 7-phosphate isomerase [Candidatus Omnitrophota bacterium]
MHVHDVIAVSLRESAQVMNALPAEQIARIANASQMMSEAIRAGGKIVWFGNGGSATQSQHMAAEFVGRFRKDRRSLPSISLTENMASVTAIGNDYAYEQIFSRQLEGLGQAGDVALGLSTSGNSPNVINGLRQAKAMRIATVGLTSGSGGAMAGVCDLCICVPSPVTARIQEAHLAIGHILCGLVEDALGLSHGSCAS